MYLLRVLEAVSQEQRGGKNIDSKADDDKSCAEAVGAYREALELFKTNKNTRLRVGTDG